MKALFISLLTLWIAVKPVPRTITSAFKPPVGYTALGYPQGSFANWLQHLPLKPAGTHTRTYDGQIANTDAYTAAVVDMSVGNTDLQQCADAVMRLRGEYLFQKKDYKAITFHFTSGFECDFVHYAEGYRYLHERWVKQAHKDYSYANFMRYMKLVFTYAGTKSLQKELTPVNDANSLKVGDVFIWGGSPGHCFIVLNVAVNSKHQKRFIIAQSYIPAQNIQVLHNDNGSPWFNINEPANVPAGGLVNLYYLRSFPS